MTTKAAVSPVITPPAAQELASTYAAHLASTYASTVSDAHKKAFGQYFTPAELGTFLASLSTVTSPTLRMLDPGFGTGVLAGALVEHLVHPSQT